MTYSMIAGSETMDKVVTKIRIAGEDFHAYFEDGSGRRISKTQAQEILRRVAPVREEPFHQGAYYHLPPGTVRMPPTRLVPAGMQRVARYKSAPVYEERLDGPDYISYSDARGVG